MTEESELIARYQILRSQEQEINDLVSSLMKKGFILSARANFLRNLFTEKTGNWLDIKGSVIVREKTMKDYSP